MYCREENFRSFVILLKNHGRSLKKHRPERALSQILKKDLNISCPEMLKKYRTFP
jgi:hypothetical protein